MSLEAATRIVRDLASRGYNVEQEAVTLLSREGDTAAAIEAAVEVAPDGTAVLTVEHVRNALDTHEGGGDSQESAQTDTAATPPTDDPLISPAEPHQHTPSEQPPSPVETKGSSGTGGAASADGPAVEKAVVGERDSSGASGGAAPVTTDRDPGSGALESTGDIRSRGTGEYEDFVAVFRDRYEKLAERLRGRVNHRPTNTLESMSAGSDAAIIGMVSDIRTTGGGHWLVELEDTNGTFPCMVLKDRDIAGLARELLTDEVIAIEGSLSDDSELLFADAVHFPDVPRTHTPSTADRHVEAALISDIHVGSEEFVGEAWERFAQWLHTDAADRVEYLLIAGDMVEGVGVYPGQDEELDIIDIYDQYEAFSEHLKSVPGDLEVIMIPGNHDAVRLAEPQPAFDEELRDIMSAHTAQIAANPATVTVEGVDILMYHGVSLDEVIAELPPEKASYDRPQDAMAQLLKKRHVAPQYGGNTRIAPEPEDHLVIEDVPDVFHTGHVHKLGYGTYHNVLTINSSCWQAQTDFQKSVNLDPDVAYAPILDLGTLDLTVQHFL